MAQEYEPGDVNFKAPAMHWHHAGFNFTRSTFNQKEFDQAIESRIRDPSKPTNYKHLTDQMLDDIITCAASIEIQEFQRRFKFVDLNKA